MNVILRIVLDWRNSEHVYSKMLTDHKITWEEHSGWFARAKDNKPSRSLIFEYEGRPLGYIGYTEYDEEHLSCSPGAYMGETADVPLDAGLNLFYMSLEYAFQTLNMESLKTSVFADNRKAIKLDEFLVYKRFVGQDEFCEKDGNKKKAYRYAMTKSE